MQVYNYYRVRKSETKFFKIIASHILNIRKKIIICFKSNR